MKVRIHSSASVIVVVYDSLKVGQEFYLVFDFEICLEFIDVKIKTKISASRLVNLPQFHFCA